MINSMIVHIVFIEGKKNEVVCLNPLFFQWSEDVHHSSFLLASYNDLGTVTCSAKPEMMLSLISRGSEPSASWHQALSRQHPALELHGCTSLFPFWRKTNKKT